LRIALLFFDNLVFRPFTKKEIANSRNSSVWQLIKLILSLPVKIVKSEVGRSGFYLTAKLPTPARG